MENHIKDMQNKFDNLISEYKSKYKDINFDKILKEKSEERLKEKKINDKKSPRSFADITGKLRQLQEIMEMSINKQIDQLITNGSIMTNVIMAENFSEINNKTKKSEDLDEIIKELN